MESGELLSSSYKGSKDFNQRNVRTANASGFEAAPNDYAERGIDLNEQLVRNEPATFFMRVNGNAMMDAGIYLVAYKQHDGDELNPYHDGYQHSNRSINFIVSAEIGNVIGKSVGYRQDQKSSYE